MFFSEGTVQQEKVGALCAKFTNDLAPGAMETFERRLSDANEEAYLALAGVRLKSAKIAQFLSIFLGGFAAGRFYLGDIWGGLFKLVTVVLLNTGFGVLAAFFTPWVLFVPAAIVWAWYVVDVVRAESNTLSVNTAKLFNTVYATYLPPKARRKTRAWKSRTGYAPAVFSVDAADGLSIAGFALAPIGVLGLVLSSVGFAMLKRQERPRTVALVGIVFGCLWTLACIVLIFIVIFIILAVH